MAEPVLCEGVTNRRYLPPCVHCGAGVHAVNQGGHWMWVHFVWEADEHCGAAVPPPIATGCWITCSKCGVEVPTFLADGGVCDGCRRTTERGVAGHFKAVRERVRRQFGSNAHTEEAP